MGRNSLSGFGTLVLFLGLNMCGAVAHAADSSSEGFVDVPGAKIFYEVAGTLNDRPPVVFIHGNTGDSRHWDRQFQALAKQFRVIRYDVRAYGKSIQTSEGVAYFDHEDLAALL